MQRLSGRGHHRLDTVGGTVAGQHDADAAEGGQLRDYQVQGGAHRPERLLGGGQIQPGGHGDAAAAVVYSEQHHAGVGVEPEQERDQGEQVLGAADVDSWSIGERHGISFQVEMRRATPAGNRHALTPPVAGWSAGGSRRRGVARVVGDAPPVRRCQPRSGARPGCLVRWAA